MPDGVVEESDRPRRLPRSTCERLVLHLLKLGILSDDFHFTAFSVIHYVVTGARAHALESKKLACVSFDVSEGEADPDGPRKKANPKVSSAVTASRQDKGKGGLASRRKEKAGEMSVDVSASTTDKPSCRDGGGNDGQRPAGERYSDEGEVKGEGRGRGKKRARPETATRAVKCANAEKVVDLCDSEDEESVFRRDRAKGVQRSGWTQAVENTEDGIECTKGEGEESWGSGDDDGVGDRCRGYSVGAFDVDRDDIDDFEPVKRKHKNSKSRKGAMQEEID